MEEHGGQSVRAEQNRVLIWGTGGLYNQHFNLIKLYEARGDFRVAGVTSNNPNIHSRVDGYPFFRKEEISEIDFDYCLVAVEDLASVMEEVGKHHVDMKKLIPIRVLSIPYFSFEKYIRLKRSRLSILSNNCFAGICYHRFGLEFLSPTINMVIDPAGYNRFMAHLDDYLSLPVEFVKMGWETQLEREYPIGKVGDISLYFNHYVSFEDARDCWERRKARLNRANLLAVYYADSMDAARAFDALPYAHKIVFTSFDCGRKTAYNIVGADQREAPLQARVNDVAMGNRSNLDMLGLLLHEDGYIRIG